MKQFAQLGAVWFGNSKQHFAFSAYDRLNGWNKLAEAFNDDYPTKKLILKWIDDEKEHMAWEAQYLNYIEKLGYENFLTAMM